MKYLTEEKFTVTSNDKDALKRFRDNWDATFGPRRNCKACNKPLSDEEIKNEYTVCDSCHGEILPF